ncbi:PREDICTED: pre-rRNA-processing protein esf2-like [Ceratosolen solmsi marchali]|uniref:Activator of basal transcription 1 n=1 Tax=Ceratosolen solmsi marchali TaxID=326594 RepID=A0AAJ7E145_9HYME|nr:PREDICTED: pre-rRNA-processing protein esf2-like [Ceratosolen solmsi marchali]
MSNQRSEFHLSNKNKKFFDLIKANSKDNKINKVSNLNDKINNKFDIKKPLMKKRGIIYLATIPKYMNVIKIREIFSAYGEIGRVYLQLANKLEGKNAKKKLKTPVKHFTEGWVEFEKKKVAKFVASTLNNCQISCQKKSKFYDVIWNIKYLPRFKWTHLSERLAYERAIYKQILRTEISQAKKEVNFFSFNIDRSKKLKIGSELGKSSNFALPQIYQKETDIKIKENEKKLKYKDREDFLKALFG